MRNTIISIIFCALISSCSDYLDLVPKGSTLLDSADDLEKLLNSSFIGDAFAFDDLLVLSNASYGLWAEPDLIIEDHNGMEYINLTYDETEDREQYLYDDYRYNTYYRLINVRNVFLQQIEKTEVDAERKASLIAEARIMRAYIHYLLVNIYAKQYDESTADDTGGIAYVSEMNVEDTPQKLNLAEVYKKLLEDTDETYIQQLPDKAANQSRVGKPLGYAVRAKILFQMKNYGEALKMVTKALECYDVIDDKKPLMNNPVYERDYSTDNNLLWAAGWTTSYGYVLSAETSLMFEEGDIMLNYAWQDAKSQAPVWSSEDGEWCYWGASPVYMFCSMKDYTNQGGITCEQLHYIKGECLIRTGKIAEGLEEVNKVRRCRIDPAVYSDYSASTEKEAMALLQRAKWIECILTYNNFFDLKRWNSEPEYKTTITREIYGTTYTLRPESPLWVIPFPAKVLKYNPSMSQNY